MSPTPTSSNLSPTAIGLLVGTVLGFAAAFGGLSGFVLVALFAVAGVIAGNVVEGRIDLSSYLGARGRAHR